MADSVTFTVATNLASAAIGWGAQRAFSHVNLIRSQYQTIKGSWVELKPLADGKVAFSIGRLGVRYRDARLSYDGIAWNAEGHRMYRWTTTAVSVMKLGVQQDHFKIQYFYVIGEMRARPGHQHDGFGSLTVRRVGKTWKIKGGYFVDLSEESMTSTNLKVQELLICSHGDLVQHLTEKAKQEEAAKFGDDKLVHTLLKEYEYASSDLRQLFEWY